MADQPGGGTRASVVVVTFNHRVVVPRCLDAVLNTLGPDDEVIVVDNASTDGTAEMLAARYPDARLLREATNRGFGAACNRGAAVAAGEVLVFLNPDTEPLEGWLDPLVAEVLYAPGQRLASARLLLDRDRELVDAMGNEVHLSGITTSHGWREPAERHARRVELSAISGACFAISRAFFTRLGGFDERLFLYYEDTDLSLRARLAGARCIAVPESRVLHDHLPGFTAAKLRHLERNRWWTLLKLYRPRTLLALAPVLLLGELLAWGMALAHGPGHLRAKALAWLDLARWLPDLPTERARARATRALEDEAVLRLHTGRLRFGQVAAGRAGRAGERATTLLTEANAHLAGLR